MPRISHSRGSRHLTQASALPRLQKVLAAAGVGSRRECEQLILEGRVEVDRQVVTRLGTCVDPAQHEVRVDGQVLARRAHVYYMINKPKGVVSTNRDPAGRARVIDLVPPAAGRLFNVGRLDKSSEGLILVTNDGQLANELTHPRYGVPKTYQVEVAGHPEPQTLSALRRGIRLAEGPTRVLHVQVRRSRKHSTVLEVVLGEGRNREIRRLLARCGHKVMRLVRIAVGPLRLGNLPPGAYRPLERHELAALRRAIHDASSQRGRRPKPGSPV
jgi:23S rRNA pseudouridine2605 synthase